MKLTPDDPRLSAWLLGELPPAEAAAVERAVAADPALRLVLDELKGVTSLLEATLSSAPAGLRHDQREAIRRAGREADAAGKVIDLASARRGRNPWVAALGAAAAVIVAVGLTAKLTGPGGRLGKAGTAPALSDEIALLPMPVPGAESGNSGAAGGGTSVSAAPAEREAMLRDDPAGFLDRVSRRLAEEPVDPAKLPRVHPLPGLSASDEIRLPLVVGHASYGWVRGWLREKDGLPPKDAVRIEELINTFPLAAEGLRVEAADCPWNPGGKLVACTLSAPAERALEANWFFVPAEGAACRLLAAPGDGRSVLPVRLPAGRSVTVLLEVKPAGDTAGLGLFRIQSKGDEVREFEAGPVAAPSPAMRQVVLMAAFGMWLRGEGVDGAALETTLAAAGEDDDPGRADSRRLVREALDRSGD